MKNLFIDSNVWLSLYHFSGTDLAQFGMLEKYLGKSIRLFVPKQVHDEVFRNREGKIKDALKEFDVKPINFPNFCKDYDEYQRFNSDYRKLLKNFQDWKKTILHDIEAQKLSADLTIQKLFNQAGTIICDEYIDNAFKRYCSGNPPGKGNSYGDAIIWECLLDCVPLGEDLYLISCDKDFSSSISSKLLNPFLENEWKVCKKSKILFYTSLQSFLSEHLQEIKFNEEKGKEMLIAALTYSPNYRETHGIISKLKKHTNWSVQQIEELCLAAEMNTQVDWIFEDNDIFDFYSNFLFVSDYEKLDDCATKRIMERVIDIIKKQKSSSEEASTQNN